MNSLAERVAANVGLQKIVNVISKAGKTELMRSFGRMNPIITSVNGKYVDPSGKLVAAIPGYEDVEQYEGDLERKLQKYRRQFEGEWLRIRLEIGSGGMKELMGLLDDRERERRLTNCKNIDEAVALMLDWLNEMIGGQYGKYIKKILRATRSYCKERNEITNVPSGFRFGPDELDKGNLAEALMPEKYKEVGLRGGISTKEGSWIKLIGGRLAKIMKKSAKAKFSVRVEGGEPIVCLKYLAFNFGTDKYDLVVVLDRQGIRQLRHREVSVPTLLRIIAKDNTPQDGEFKKTIQLVSLMEMFGQQEKYITQEDLSKIEISAAWGSASSGEKGEITLSVPNFSSIRKNPKILGGIPFAAAVEFGVKNYDKIIEASGIKS
ncbi:hypothetical protein FJZ26_03415 [Candidatus Parvarchaeota archaeon]|nr:hypothetical protein [Candidatus Parvarchaeota archaeon]